MRVGGRRGLVLGLGAVVAAAAAGSGPLAGCGGARARADRGVYDAPISDEQADEGAAGCAGGVAVAGDLTGGDGRPRGGGRSFSTTVGMDPTDSDVGGELIDPYQRPDGIESEGACRASVNRPAPR